MSSMIHPFLSTPHTEIFKLVQLYSFCNSREIDNFQFSSTLLTLQTSLQLQHQYMKHFVYRQ